MTSLQAYNHCHTVFLSQHCHVKGVATWLRCAIGFDIVSRTCCWRVPSGWETAKKCFKSLYVNTHDGNESPVICDQLHVCPGAIQSWVSREVRLRKVGPVMCKVGSVCLQEPEQWWPYACIVLFFLLELCMIEEASSNRPIYSACVCVFGGSGWWKKKNWYCYR